MSLLESNRNNRKDVKPKKTAKLSDIDNENVASPNGKKTTLTIDSGVKNKLQALVLMGDASSLKEGMAVAMQSYYNHLSDNKKQMFDILYNSLEQNDK